MKPFYKKTTLVLTLFFSFALVHAQDTTREKSNEMKKVLIIGRLATNIPSIDDLVVKNVELFGATNLEEVKNLFAKNNNKIDIVIMGAGIALKDRLEMVAYIFASSDSATVHMKDRATGPGGFWPFINNVLKGLLQAP